MKLYYAPQTRAGRVRWLLEELEVPYTLERLDLKARTNRTPEYLAIHPHGAVPTLVDGDVTLIESAAILLYLADKYIERGLAPPLQSPERGAYYQWIVYAMVTAEKPGLDYLAHTVRLPEERPDPKVAEEARARFAEVARFVEGALAGHEYLVGDRFSAADVVMGSVMIVARIAGLLADYPNLAAYAKRLGDRPASKRARAD
jgi:glutathione S-transferase